MASFTLTVANGEILLGLDTEADIFTVSGPARLVGADTVRGGINAHVDTLRLTAVVTLAAADFANVRDIERLQITSVGGATVTLDDAMVASTNRVDFQVLGGIGGDTVLGGAVLATQLLMQGDAGNDRMEAGGGNDLLRPGSGADTMYGGAGNDTIEIALTELGTNDRLDGGAGNDVLRVTGAGGNIGAAHFAALAGIERIELAAGVVGALTVNVGAGYTLGGAALTVAGGAAADKFVATGASLGVVFLGGEGNDTLVGGAFADSLSGGEGNDLLNANGGADTVDGGAGDDRINGGEGSDWLAGGAGNDTISGGGGADTIDLGGVGADFADGGAGNDLYRVAVTELNASDLITDETGTADALVLTDVRDVVSQSFFGITISGTLAGRILGIERFVLGSGNDTILAGNAIGDSAGADVVTISGGDGNDRLDVTQVVRLTTPLAFLLDGGDGADSLIGGRGADTLSPGSGNDRVLGGHGNDLVLIASAEFDALDALDGEAGTDTLRLVGNEDVGSAAFSGLAGIEIVELAAGGQAVTVPGAFADALGFTMSTIRGSDGDDLVDVSAFSATRRVTVELGAGDDTLFGGDGNDTVFAGPGVDSIHVGGGINRVTFGVGELSGLDVVTANRTAFDTLVVGVAAGRTLAQGVFGGISGFDTFNLDGGAGSAARLPANLVTQSGQPSINVNVMNGVGEAMAVDGRAIAAGFRLDGGGGNDTLFGGSGADTLVGNGGDDVLIGGVGGDRILLGASVTSEREVALLRAVSDGTGDINTTQNVAGADSVSGTEFEGKFIMVDRIAFGLSDAVTWFVGAGQNISLNYAAARLEGVFVAGDAFGTLAAVRSAVGARFVNNNPAEFEKIILVITGSTTTRFGVYYFEDRDHNATVDSTDILRLLAIGTGAGPGTTSMTNGFRLTSEFELL